MKLSLQSSNKKKTLLKNGLLGNKNSKENDKFRCKQKEQPEDDD